MTDNPLPTHAGPGALIDQYFAAVTTRDVEALRALFSPAAVVQSGAERLVGRDAIMRYYTENTFTFDDFRPEPGPKEIDHTRVTVPLKVRLGGQDHSVIDVFDTDGDQIMSLHITGFDEALRAARSDSD